MAREISRIAARLGRIKAAKAAAKRKIRKAQAADSAVTITLNHGMKPRRSPIKRKSGISGVTQLGRKVFAAADPASAIIETAPAPIRRALDANDEEQLPWYRFICSEFTSLCPVTGQPDFAAFVIDYIPSKRLIESKSLKLFFASFRNYAGFAEAATGLIADRLYNAARPELLIVDGYWAARGGIPIQVFEKRGANSAAAFHRRPPVPTMRY